MSSLIPLSSSTISPSTTIARLIPQNVMTVGKDTIYWFHKEGKARVRDCAMLVITRGKETFKLQYYPKDGPPQIVKELEMGQLAAAVSDLAASGFPVRRDPAPPLRTVSPEDSPPLPLPASPLSLT